MKNTSIIINVAVIVALAVLYVLHFSGKNNNGASISETSTVAAGDANFSVAIINIDSILFNYNLAKELNDALTKKQAIMKAKLEKDGREFEKDAQIFQDKLQRGIYLTQQRAEEAQQQLVMRQQELQELEYDYTNQLSREQQTMNAQLFDSVSHYINEYNKPEKYKIILGKSITSNILYGATQLDITNEILVGLNARYPAKK